MSRPAAIRLVLPEGRAAARGLRAAHLVAIGCALAACGLTLVGALLTAAVLVHLYSLEARRRALADSCLAVLYDSAGGWHLQRRDGTRETLRLARRPVVSPWLTLLVLDGPAGRIGLFVTPDMLDADSFRRLRMRLLWQGTSREEPVR